MNIESEEKLNTKEVVLLVLALVLRPVAFDTCSIHEGLCLEGL